MWEGPEYSFNFASPFLSFSPPFSLINLIGEDINARVSPWLRFCIYIKQKYNKRMGVVTVGKLGNNTLVPADNNSDQKHY